MNFRKFKNYFFIGIAGTGMSALAQFLKFSGFNVKGSDRLFDIYPGHKIRKQLENLNIKTYPQGKGILDDADVVIVSTAIEENVPEYQKAKILSKPVFHRSDLLASISADFKSVAITGTSGKSTTTALIFHILQQLEKPTAIINGASLISLTEKGFIGNAFADAHSKYLVFEADESDQTVTKYSPFCGVILNLQKDHLDKKTLLNNFKIFANKSNFLIKNLNDKNLEPIEFDTSFGCCPPSEYYPENFQQKGKEIFFNIKKISFQVPLLGFHNALNVSAAVATIKQIFPAIPLETIAKTLLNFKGLKRRTEIIFEKKGITIIDDYAHNPSKIKATLSSLKEKDKHLIIFFRPHGFKPLSFFYDDLVKVFNELLTEKDYLFVGKVFYAGGTVSKTKTSSDLVNDLKKYNKNVFYSVDDTNLINFLKNAGFQNATIIIMGSRDPKLTDLAIKISNIFK